MKEDNPKPLISVAVPVYNQGAFIAKALESILIQKTNYDFEIVIGDDCSTDNTREILLKYKEQYPHKIVLLFSDENIGVNKNAFNIYQNCRGKYIAMLEGDDHWTYENKLQKQVDFLENNTDYAACFHDALIVSAMTTDVTKHNQYHAEFKYYSQFNKYPTELNCDDIIERIIIPTASMVFRNNINFLEFFNKYGDIRLSLIWALQIHISFQGKFRYFNEIWSVYNDHSAGMSKWETLNDYKFSNIKILKRFASDNSYKHLRKSIYKTMASEFRQILLNPQNKKLKKSLFYKYVLSYIINYLKFLRWDLLNISDFRKNLRK